MRVCALTSNIIHKNLACGAGATEMGYPAHPPSPSKIKAQGPWLSGTFRTPKVRVCAMGAEAWSGD